MALYAIYGRHEIDQCPWNNKERAKQALEIASSDWASILPKYKIHNIVGQYHLDWNTRSFGYLMQKTHI